MSYYLRPFPGAPPQVWQIENDVAVQLGVTNPEHGLGTYFKANPGETIWDAILRLTPWFEPHGRNPFIETVLGPGEFYPRMARPNNIGDPGWSPSAQFETNIVAIARGQLTTLTRQLDRICQTVHPTTERFSTYGHDIRNLLILACTEVETHWRGVLDAKDVTKDRYYNTKDYVMLRDAMKLDGYAVMVPNYTWLAAFKPYEEWGSTDSPTRDLKWYDAYNGVKRSRETQFKRAALRYVFEAVSACVIMMVAQFGLHGDLLGSELRSFFHFSAVLAWPLSEFYLLPYGKPTAPVHFGFKATTS